MTDRALGAAATGDGTKAIEFPAHLRNSDVLLRVEDLVVEFQVARSRVVHAVSGVSLDLERHETLGLVGESGSGKSSMARAIACLPRPTSGRVLFEGTDLTALTPKELRRRRPAIQLIFQNPISSLNPRRRVGDIIADPLRIWPQTGVDAVDRVVELLDNVGLEPDVRDSFPHQLSGGQCQRVAIARALVLNPALLLCDEPTSALDTSVQAQLINLFRDTQSRYGLAMIFVSHDLAVIRNITDRTAVMYLGKLCEVGSTDQIYEGPAHHYTRALLDAVPDMDPNATRPSAPKGELPSPVDPPSGCRFRTRCPSAQEICAVEEPRLRPVGTEQWVACHFPIHDAAQQNREDPMSDSGVTTSGSRSQM